jgi:hypothetical protein
MALWQVGFFILPKRSLELCDKFDFSGEHSFDDSPFWQLEKVSLDFFVPVNSILPQTKSWGDYLVLYGNENSNRFEVVFEKDTVESVSFRIDFTSNYEPILSQIIEFCILNNLIILDEELNVVPLNFEQARSVVENAPQVKKYNELSRPNIRLN